MIPTAVRPALVVSRTTLRQTYRKVRGSPRMTAVFAAISLFFGAQLAGVGTTGGYDYGRRLASGDAAAVSERVRAAAVSGVVLLSLLGVLGAAAGNSEFKDRYVAFLTATTTRAVVVGNAARQTFVWTAMFWPAAAAGAVAFAVGASAPVAVVSLALGSLWLFVVTSALTIPVGFAARWVLDGYDLSRNARSGLGVGLMGAFYLVLFSRGAVVDALAGTPAAWAGDLLLLTVPGTDADPTLAAGFVAITAGLVAAALEASVRLADAVWYGDPTFGSDRDRGVRTDSPPANRIRDGLATVLSRETAALVEVTWRRTKRTPETLWYVYPAAFVGLVTAERLVYDGPFSAAMYPVVAAFAGSVAVGSGFTLNPLGTEGDALPALLTSGLSGADVVRSKALAVAVPGLVLVAGGSLAVALVVGSVPPSVTAATVAFALALSLLAPTLSLALGVHYPPDSEGLFGGSVAVPNKSASAAYTLGMVAVALPGFGALGRYALTDSVSVVSLSAGTALTVALALALSRWSYRHAVKRLDAYSIE